MAGVTLRSPDRGREAEASRLGRLLLPGADVGRWVVTDVLREEPAYVVYEATRGPDGCPGTLKLVDPIVLHDARYHKRLRRAARDWKRVVNPGVARLLDAGKSPEGPYLVIEPVVGPSLACELKSGAMSPARATRIAFELGSALDVTINAGIMPGALTPREVAISPLGAVIMDPGVGRARQRKRVDETDEALDYLSPEEAVGAAPLPQSAVYSLACIVHECLTGEPPYSHDLPQAVLYAHVAGPPALPRERDSSLPRALDGVFERAMAADPEDRHRTPSTFARDLAAALGYAGEPTTDRADPKRPALVVVPDIVPSKRVEAERNLPDLADPELEVVPPTATRHERRQGKHSVRSRGRSGQVLRSLVVLATIAACATGGFAAGSAGDSDSPAPVAPRAEAGPPAGVLAAQGIAERLEGSRGRLRARLAEAPKRAGQAELAGRLSSTYAASASRSPAATPPEVRQTLRGSARAYARLAAAARRGKAPAWNDARARVRSTDLALARALRRTSASR